MLEVIILERLRAEGAPRDHIVQSDHFYGQSHSKNQRIENKMKQNLKGFLSVISPESTTFKFLVYLSKNFTCIYTISNMHPIF